MTTHDTLPDYFDPVIEALEDALLVAFDGCHKIYVAMDEEQADWFRENYERNVDHSPEAMLHAIKLWWVESCPLKFVNAVTTNHADPNAGFTTLIGQFDWCEDEDDEDDDWDEE